MLVNDLIEEFVQQIVSKIDNSTDDWIACTVNKSNIFFQTVSFFSSLRCWINTD